MDSNNYDRINILSEKVRNLTASKSEIEEFSELVKNWINSKQLNLVSGLSKH